jgi:nucleoside-diphosphate-sugar epimerase
MLSIHFILLLYWYVVVTPKSSHGLSIQTTKSNLREGDFLILGLGRVGLEVARLAIDHGVVDNVIGTVRHLPASQDDDSGIGNDDSTQRILFGDPNLCSLARRCRYVLVTIPPSRDQQEYLDFLFQNVLNEIGPGCWIGLISTTGVYGNHDGEWVTEESECKCISGNSSSAGRFLDYEAKWKSWATMSNAHSLNIFRCAGIYSLDQSALHTVYRKGYECVTDQDAKSKSLTNRIHVYDIARAVVFSMENFQSSEIRNDMSLLDSGNTDRFRIYNLADNLPESRDVVLSFAANMLKGIGVDVATPHPLALAKGSIISPIVQSRNRESRRLTDWKLVSNHRMLRELLPESGLTYPTYKEGLTNILEHRSNPWWS